MKLPGFGGMSFKQLRMAKRAMHIMKATALSAMDPVKAAHLGMKVVDKAITTGVKAGKEGGFLRGLAEGAKSLGTGSLLGMSKMTKKPKLTFDEAYEVYKTGVEADHASYAKAATRAADVAKQMTAAGFKPKRMRLPKPPARLLLKHEWAPKKVEGVDYGGPAPTWDLDALKKDHPDTWEHLAPKRVFRGTHKFLMGKKGWASAGALGGLGWLGLGYAGDKERGQFDVQSGHLKAAGVGKFMHLHNPEGHGRSLEAKVGGGWKGKRNFELGMNMGFGHARSAGVAHQAGVHMKIDTPVLKTNLGYEEQHSFGIKKRSRRVAAIRRATFGSEQHLGDIKVKPTKKQNALDTYFSDAYETYKKEKAAPLPKPGKRK